MACVHVVGAGHACVVGVFVAYVCACLSVFYSEYILAFPYSFEVLMGQSALHIAHSGLVVSTDTVRRRLCASGVNAIPIVHSLLICLIN